MLTVTIMIAISNDDIYILFAYKSCKEEFDTIILHIRIGIINCLESKWKVFHLFSSFLWSNCFSMFTFCLFLHRSDTMSMWRCNCLQQEFSTIILDSSRTKKLNHSRWSKTGGGNIRPAGHIRPAKANSFSFDFASLTEMWPARH